MRETNLSILISDLKRQGVGIKAKGADLQISDPSKSITQDQVKLIKQYKQELLKLLSSGDNAEQSGIGMRQEDLTRFPLTSSQRRLYFLQEFDRDTVSYNQPQVMEVKGMLDYNHLEKSFEELTRRHVILRFRIIEEDDEIHQEVIPGYRFAIEYFKCASKAEIDAQINSFIRPFILSTGPLFRVGLIQIAEDRHVLLLDMHHIIMDGASQYHLNKDFVRIYQKEDLPELKLDYRDYAVWQYSSERQNILKEEKAFWMESFRQLPEPLNLPSDFHRPVSKQYDGGRTGFILNRDDTARLIELGREVGATTFMSLLSIYSIWLSKLSGQEEVVIGTPVAGREHADVADMIGLFINTLALRNEINPEKSFKVYLEEVKRLTIQRFSNQTFPYEELIDLLNIERDMSRNPLFDVMFMFQNFKMAELDLPGLELRARNNTHHQSKFDLTLSVQDRSGELYLTFEYAKSLFLESTMERYVDCFRQMLGEILDAPEEPISSYRLIAPSDELLHSFEGPEVSLPDESVISLIQKQVLAQPDHIALEVKGEVLSYRELWQQVTALCGLLHGEISTGDGVGILIDRQKNLVVAELAILQMGGYFIPIDPSYPSDRIYNILEDSEVKHCLTTYELSKRLPSDMVCLFVDQVEGQVAPEPTNDPQLQDLAYVIYTSGSTGRPKGVRITHQNLLNFTYGLTKTVHLGEAIRFLSLTTISFDIFQLELLVPLINGGTVLLASEEEVEDPERVLSMLAAHNVSAVQLTPSRLRQLHAFDSQLSGLEEVSQIIVGGEPFPEELRSAVLTNCKADLYNMYGPTETTIWSSYKCLKKEEGRVSIGRPMSNTQLYVLDKSGLIQPVGVPGELYIGGLGVGAGYLNREAETSDRFVSNPFGNGTLYRTGDLVRRTDSGELQFLGRTDDQIKVRGYRIEPGEIASVMQGLSGVTAAFVVKEGDHLVGYYTGDVTAVDLLRNHLAGQFPDYMIPTFFQFMMEFPMTANGKIDRKALPKVSSNALEDKSTYSEGVMGEKETRMAVIWGEVLGIDPKACGPGANFFQLGGHSLNAIQLLRHIRQEFEVDVTLREVFEHQTLDAMTELVVIRNWINFDPEEMEYKKTVLIS